MRTQIITITLGILMLGLASAMIAGESMSFETNLTNPVYTVTGNSSNLEGLNVTFENGNITISTVINYNADNFTMLFFDNITHEVIRTVSSGSSGSRRTKYVDRNITKNITTYVPEYINNTVEVEKIVEVDSPITMQEGFSMWKLLFSMLVALISGLWMGYAWRDKNDREVSDED